MFTIHVQLADHVPQSKVIAICKDYDCKAKKIPGNRYEVASDDPSNFFHLGLHLYRKLAEV